MKRLSVLLAVCIGLSATFALAKPGGPPSAKKQNEPIVGTVLKIDGTNIVIQTHGKDAGEKTIPTDPKTVFELNGSASSLDKIKAGMEVAATPKTGIATKVVADAEPSKPKKPKKK